MHRYSLFPALVMLAACGAPSSTAPDPDLSPLEGALSRQQIQALRTRAGLTDRQLASLTPAQALRRVRKLDKATEASPGAALQWRRKIMEDENGNLTPNGIVKAMAHRDQMIGLEFDSGGIQRGSWTWIGPGNAGGRCRGLWIQPANPNVLVLGSVGGGIWRSTNAGASWESVHDFPASLAIGCIAAPPRSNLKVWAGTGEGFGNGDAIRGAGIYQSLDGGKTFAVLPSTANGNFYYVNRIAFHPTNQDIALVATSSGIWRTTTGGRGSTSQAWTRTSTTRSLDVKFHPTDPNLAIAAGKFSGATRYSLNGGLSWATASGLPTTTGRVELAYAPSAPRVVYASCEIRGGSSRVYLSVNGGRSFLLRSATGILGGQGWYDNAIWVDPSNSSIIVVGGIGLYRSVNSGSTFTNIGGIHADQHVIQHHPSYNGTSNRVVYVCNDGGIFRAGDIRTVSRTSGWTNLNNRLGITQFYGGDISPNGRPYGGTQDNGTQQLSNGTTKVFRQIAGGDGMLCQADPTNSNTLFGETQWAGVFRSTNGGNSTQSIVNNMADTGANSAPWIGAMRLDPNNPNRLWMGSARLWRTDNARTSNPASVSWRMVRGNVEYYTSVDVARGNSNIVVAAEDTGAVYRSTNATATSPTWVRIDGTLPNRYITKIRIDPLDHDRIFVSFGGFVSGNVWFTADAGRSWRQASGSGATALPPAPVRALALHPRNSGWVYAGTEVGVFASTDDGRTWSTSNDGPATISVDELVVRDDGSIFAFTHGRGLYRGHAGTNRDAGAGTARASLTWLDGQSNGHSYQNSLSGNGRYVAFASDATNLVAIDSNARRDIFVRDRQEGTTQRVSINSSGVQANNASQAPDLSADGRFVAFSSRASNLVSGDSNARDDIFVRDRTFGTTERVSVTSSGFQANNHSYEPSLSANGRFVVFYSLASNLLGGDSNSTYDVYRRDRRTNTTIRVSAIGSFQAANGSSFSSRQCVSADGRFVVFQSNATNLVSGDTNGGSDIFLREYGTVITTRRISVSSSGGQANGSSYLATISADGRYVAYYSSATNLVPGDSNGRMDVFLYDRITRRTSRMSTTPTNVQGNGHSTQPVISDDGNSIVFESAATNFGVDTNNRNDVFVRTRNPSRLARVSVDSQARQANNASTYASISEDGKFVSYYSSATNLVDNDTNARSDVFVSEVGSSSFVYPIRLANVAGSSATALPLSSSNTRLQQVARETQTRRMVIRRIAFRRDTRANNTVSIARTIDLQMSMGDTDIENFSARFATNFIGASTRVIERKQFSVPDWRTRPAGVPGFDASLPLDSPYPHSGAHQLLWDITTFANSTTGTHFIDAHSENLVKSSSSSIVGVGCRTNTGSNFGHSFSVVSDGPTSSLTIQAFQAPARAPISIGIGVTNPNLQLPGFCTRLYTDAAAILPLGNSDAAGRLTLRLAAGPWQTANRGLLLHTQAFSPLGTGYFSYGQRIRLPTTNPGPLLKRVFASPRSAATGTLQDFGSVFQLVY